jgi:NADPH-dependent curcumin reductase CurA
VGEPPPAGRGARHVTAALNRRMVLARRPAAGAIRDEDFRLEAVPLPEPGEGEVVVRVDVLGFDPAQRGWLDAGPSYVEPVRVGDVMRASGIGEVVASRHERWPVGTVVAGLLGWQEHARCDGRQLWQVPDGIAPGAALGLLGTPGLTAYFGLLEVGRVQAGDVVLVSAAAGATGSVVGQLAKLHGARAIGIAGGPRKCAWLTDVAGFDAAIDYKREDVATRLGELAPDGVDLFYDNVGGAILDAGLLHLAERARVVVCGAISTRYAISDRPPPGVRNLPQLLVKRARMEGFIVLDFRDRHAAARERLAGWLHERRIVTAVDLQRGGIEDAPATLRRLFEGRNLGKQVLELARRP